MMNFTVLRRIAPVVLLAGILAGLLLTAVQKLQVTPIIAQAEVYEESAAAVAHAHESAAASLAATGADGAPAAAAHAHPPEHEHGAAEWEPAHGFERSAYTALAKVSMAIGFALFLTAAITLAGRPVSWRAGLGWSVAGYLVFFVAPALGLPPEVPGTLAAPLHERQLWWLMSAVLTALGLAMMVYGRHWGLQLAGVLPLLLPHLLGAPQPEVHGGAAPQELAQAFIRATALANGVFWLALGSLTAYFHQKFS